MKIVEIQSTPNPNALKFIVAETFPSGSHSFMSVAEAEKDPLAKTIFALGNVTSVFYINNFLTVSKTPDGNWTTLKPAVLAALTAAK